MSVTVGQLLDFEEEQIESMPDKLKREEARYRLNVEREYFQRNGVLVAFNLIYKEC